MTRIRSILLCVAMMPLAAMLARTAVAQDAAFAGRWQITGANLAPWAVPGRSDDKSEENRLVGRSVTFAPRSVTGPSPLACGKPRYETHDDAPDMLFQGGLAEPDDKGNPRDAEALARGIGMTTKTVLTLETSCSQVAFHRLAPDTLVFGLNDRLYTMHRVTAR